MCAGAGKPNSKVLISINFEKVRLQPQYTAVLQMEPYTEFLVSS